MEMNRVISPLRKPLRVAVLLISMLLASAAVDAQVLNCGYFVRDGRMHIELAKTVAPASLDSFIRQFELEDLYLQKAIFGNMLDSLKSKGWQVLHNDRNLLAISKPLMPIGELKDPEDKIILAEKDRWGNFDPVNNGVAFGVNRFRNKNHFEIQDSIVIFFLRGHANARMVMLAGSFNNWSQSRHQMRKVDSGWIARVALPAGKYWYKFIVDGSWNVDEDNLLRENDGKGNTNSVYYRPNHVFLLTGYLKAKNVYLAGSFNNWRDNETKMLRTQVGWGLPVYLANGTHQYRYVVDGNWISDDENPQSVPNEHGATNSVVQLGESQVFRLNGFASARNVFLVGSFNEWRENQLPMKRTATGWELPYVLGPGNYTYRFLVDGKWTNGDSVKPAAGTNLFLVIDTNYTFRLKGFPNAKKVVVAGDFNNWDPDQLLMKREGEAWVFPVHLFRGKNRYKFVVDGKWILDPGNKLWEGNEFGTGNSVIWFGENQ